VIEELDLVILTSDLPSLDLKAGNIGTVVLVHGDGVGYEVEFVTMTGDTLGVETLSPDQLRKAVEREILHSRAIA
jgi:hypothetical protein